MTKKEKIKNITSALTGLYPRPVCALFYNEPHELLIAARLSAQCTDKRVNLVTPSLFERFPTVKAFAEADVSEIEELVRSCGLGKIKARDIVGACAMLTGEFGGIIPDELDRILKLPGIGRKTGNLLIGTLYGKPAVVTDTHVIRLSNRLGLVKTKAPEKVESELRKLLPPSLSLDFCHRMVLFGRDVCKAQNPQCSECVLKSTCIFC